ncbi:Gibberellin-regulated family protein [Actinidia rufa]|uniref:Gibberellin-regulated family protein n=1 Tax=Actinidia rufa TaxID=165716 RepID=A0A7J0EPC0_9ERIC|nr:Gibberellin-regulated family protein [Actinidia rufa]
MVSRCLILLMVVLFCIAQVSSDAKTGDHQTQTVERCARIGVVCIQGQTCALGLVVLAVSGASVCLQALQGTKRCVAPATPT